MMFALPLWVCLLCVNVVTSQGNASAGSKPANFARALIENPELGQTVERVLSRALGVPQPRLFGLGTALQGLFGSLALGNLQTLLTAAVPGIAIAALVISIIALVKVTLLFKTSNLDPFDTVIKTHGYGQDDKGYATGTEYGGYGRYDPTEYVHHAPQPVEYSHHDEHVHHDGNALHHAIHGDVSGYAGRRAQNVGRHAENVHQTGEESRQSSRISSSASTQDSKHSKTAKPGRVLWS